MDAQENEVALPLRSHTILGVCEALGEDFGFNPILLRAPFAASVLYSPTWAIGAYLALGAIVLVSRLLFPKINKLNKIEKIDSQAPETATEIEEQQLAKAA